MKSSRSFLQDMMDRITGRAETESDRAALSRAEKLMGVVESGAFDVLVSEVLDPLEEEAFQAFKKIEPSETLEILQTQKVAQVVEMIKRRVLAIVEEGQAAKFRIENSTQEGE